MRIKELIRKVIKALKNESTIKEPESVKFVKNTRASVLEKPFSEEKLSKDGEVPFFEVENLFEQEEEEETKNEKVTIPNSEMVGEKLMIRLPQICEVKYVITSSEGTIKRPIMKNSVYLEKNDMVFVMNYENREVCINKYQVTDIKEQNNSIHICEHNINHINQVKICALPQSVEREVKNFFHLVGKPNQLS